MTGVAEAFDLPHDDRLEHVLEAWPMLFTTPPFCTQPVAVAGGTVYVLSHSPEWSRFIFENEEALLERLLPRIGPELESEIDRIEVVPTTATAIFLARQILMVLHRLRELGAGF